MLHGAVVLDDSRVEELRKRRSKVLEHDHTLILGWSSKVVSIINELTSCAPRSPTPGRMRLVVRSGDPMDLTDLEVGSPRHARSVVIVAPEGSDDPDSVVIKTALSGKLALPPDDKIIVLAAD